MEAIKLQGRWLSAAALWSIIGAWCACGVFGWLENSAGMMSVILVALTVGAQVFAARAVKNAAETESWPRRLVLVGLGAACLAFTGWSGKQGLETSENARWASYEAYSANKAKADVIDAQIAALPMPPANVPTVRIRELAKARDAEIARLTGLKPVVGEAVAKPAPRLPEQLAWLFVALVEALELLGFYAIGRRKADAPASGANVVGFNAGRELAKKRWAA